MTKPRYQDIQGDGVPEVELGPGARARVLVGTLGGVRGPVMEVATEPVYFDLHLDAGASCTATLPERHNAFAYVYQGDARIGAAATARSSAASSRCSTHGASLPLPRRRAGRAAHRRRRAAAERAGRALRSVRDEHARGDPPGVRGLPSGPALIDAARRGAARRRAQAARRHCGRARGRRNARLQPCAIVRLPVVDIRPDRHDPRRIQIRMAAVVVALDEVDVHRLGDPVRLVEIAQEAPEVRVVDDPSQVALEVPVSTRDRSGSAS